MRQILSISLPAVDLNRMKILAKKRGYRSVSAYVQELYRQDQAAMSETELVKIAKRAKSEYKAGKAVKAKSIADLL